MFEALSADVREMVTEQIEYRELLYQMTRRDLLLRYKQTIMGFGWAIFMPLVNTVDLLGHLHARRADRRRACRIRCSRICGLLAWNFFASSLRFSVTSLTATRNLVTKVYFPREIFPFSAVIVSRRRLRGRRHRRWSAMMIYYRMSADAGDRCSCRS